MPLDLSLSITLLEKMNSYVGEQTIALGQEVFPFQRRPDLIDPTQHGEINAIQNCVQVLSSRGLKPTEIQLAFRQLSLYTVSPLASDTLIYRTLNRVRCVPPLFDGQGFANIFTERQ